MYQKKHKCHLCKKRKPFTAKYFYKSKLTKSGFEYICRECRKRKDKERVQRNKLNNWEAQKVYRLKNIDKIRAQAAVHYAIKTGKIKKLNCNFCGAVDTEAHHYDYRKQTSVIWLCKKHHEELHMWLRILNKIDTAEEI